MIIPIAIFGWIRNTIAFVKSDFEYPYKQEVVRGTGLFIAPIGSILGYITIND